MGIYILLKLLHILAVVMFMGNIYTGLFWMHRANQTSNVDIIHHTMKTIIVSDKYFTIPGVIIITAGGIAAAATGNLSMFRSGWILYGIILFSLSGIAFGWKVAPLQRKIVNYTARDNQEKFQWDEYKRLFRAWDLWGLVALLTPLAALVMMVLKLPADSFLAK